MGAERSRTVKHKYSHMSPAHFRLFLGVMLFCYIFIFFNILSFIFLVWDLPDSLHIIYFSLTLIVSFLVTIYVVRKIPPGLTMQNRFSPLTVDENWEEDNRVRQAIEVKSNAKKKLLCFAVAFLSIPFVSAVGFNVYTSVESFLIFGGSAVFINLIISLYFGFIFRNKTKEHDYNKAVGVMLITLGTTAFYVICIFLIKLYHSF